MFDRKACLVGFGLVVAGAAIVGLRSERTSQVVEQPRVPPGLPSARVPSARLHFEPNDGQLPSSLEFVARAPGLGLYLRDGGATVALGGGDSSARFDLDFVGARAGAELEPVDALRGRSHYCLGDDPDAWVRDVPHYRQVRVDELYAGIDLVWYGNPGQVEYDLVVEPGADPDLIRLAISGADDVVRTDDGALRIETGAGAVIQYPPVAFQEGPGGREPVEAWYELGRDDQVAVALGAYDAARPLVIDPVVTYSTHLGGSDDEGDGDSGSLEFATITGGGLGDIAVDEDGNAYVVGTTRSEDFPGADVNSISGTGTAEPRANAFLTKYDPTGQEIEYSVFFGGSDHDGATAVSVDGSGLVYIVGVTFSGDFPVGIAGMGGGKAAFDDSPSGSSNGFLTVISEDESSPASPNAGIAFSTTFGGNSSDFPMDVAQNGPEAIYIVGATASTNFPTINALFDDGFGGSSELVGFGDGFVYVLSGLDTGSQVVYSTYLPGQAGDAAVAVDVDDEGRATIAGFTSSPVFPIGPEVTKAATNGDGSTYDAFVLQLAADGSQILAETRLAGVTDHDYATDVVRAADGSVWVCGGTSSTDFPLVDEIQGGVEVSLVLGVTDHAFVAHLTADLSTVEFSTLLGGNDFDFASAIALDSNGNVVVGGTTGGGFGAITPLVDPFEIETGGSEAFIVVVAADDPTVLFSTEFGGGDGELLHGLATGPDGSIFITGRTRINDFDFPTVSPAQPVRGGGNDQFVVRIDPGGNEPPPNTIRSFLLPKKVAVKTSAGKGKPGVKVKAFFDTGPDAVDLSQAAELKIGPLTFQIPGLESVKNGKFFRYSDQGVSVKIKPSGIGSSKGNFTLKFSGDVGAGVDLDGPFSVSYRTTGGGNVDATGTVVLKKGKFTFGKAGGTLIEPAFSIRKGKAKTPGAGGNHSFKFVAGFTTTGPLPTVAPEIEVGFGDIFNATVPANRLKPKGKSFVLDGSIDGIQAISLNYSAERVSVRGGDVDLGNVPEGPSSLLLIFRQDDETLAVLVRVVRKGDIIKY